MEQTLNFILEQAKKILDIDSPSGYTDKAIEYLENFCKDNNLSYEKNKKGNLIVTIPGKTNYVIGLSAHVDTLGAIVRSINGDGTLRFSVIGGPLLPTLDGEYCKIYTRDNKVYTGTFLSNAPSAHVHESARSLTRDEKNMHIRIDAITKSKQDTLALGIETGNFIAIDPKTTITQEGFIKSRFLDDKISVAILLGLINYIKQHNLEIIPTLKIIFSTYEEVGHGASHIPEVDELIAVDMGCIGEDLNCTEQDVSICVKDSSGPYDYKMVNKLIQLAKENNLNYAVDVYPFYGSDVSAALRGGNNIKGALIGPGVHASHGMERTHIKAVENTLKLLIAYIKE
ncbi:MAG: M42 family metallopeptidase [Acholeplasmataceae bacterium]|nr:M42 family metallopeptidase [Acholeplasmataceae bacterium]